MDRYVERNDWVGEGEKALVAKALYVLTGLECRVGKNQTLFMVCDRLTDLDRPEVKALKAAGVIAFGVERTGHSTHGERWMQISHHKTEEIIERAIAKCAEAAGELAEVSSPGGVVEMNPSGLALLEARWKVLAQKDTMADPASVTAMRELLQKVIPNLEWLESEVLKNDVPTLALVSRPMKLSEQQKDMLDMALPLMGFTYQFVPKENSDEEYVVITDFGKRTMKTMQTRVAENQRVRWPETLVGEREPITEPGKKLSNTSHAVRACFGRTGYTGLGGK